MVVLVVEHVVVIMRVVLQIHEVDLDMDEQVVMDHMEMEDEIINLVQVV
jgi:hypothetical protein